MRVVLGLDAAREAVHAVTADGCDGAMERPATREDDVRPSQRGVMADVLRGGGASEAEELRLGVALAGAAFLLVASDRWTGTQLPDAQLRPLLTDVLTDLVLQPVA